jgi:pimeloyl-ACP methyl ester carboxylesterase
MTMRIEPFRVSIDEHELIDLRRRLAATRWPDAIDGSGWEYGTDLGYLQDLCRYWEAEFDWRLVESGLNRWPQFRAAIDGQRIHFIHARSAHRGARPLLITHGWPGSVLEFLKILGPLTDPPTYGGNRDDAFHVIAPSIPGYAWSGCTTDTGWSTARVARAFAELMTGLGYHRFSAHGGDWGAIISTQLARIIPERLDGIHLTMVGTAGRLPAQDGPPTAEEARLMAARQAYDSRERGYVHLQSTKPQTVAYSLTDSPVGLAAWIVEKLFRWTDCNGDLESVLTKDEILGGITTYWLTRTAGSSARLYFESARADEREPARGRISVPTAVALFPKEISQASRRMAEPYYNIVRWTQFARGGHFPALEQPTVLIDDIRAAFRESMS